MPSELEAWKACRLYHSSQVLDLAPGKGEDNGRLSEWFLGWKSFPALLDRVPQEKPAAHFPRTPRKFFWSWKGIFDLLRSHLPSGEAWLAGDPTIAARANLTMLPMLITCYLSPDIRELYLRNE